MFRINWFRFYSHLKIGVLASFILKISNFLMAVEIKPFYGFPYILVIFFSKFHMPKLIYKMYLPHRLWKNKKDEFCRFNEEHSLHGSGFIQFLGLKVFEQVSLKVFKVCRAVWSPSYMFSF